MQPKGCAWSWGVEPGWYPSWMDRFLAGAWLLVVAPVFCLMFIVGVALVIRVVELLAG